MTFEQWIEQRLTIMDISEPNNPFYEEDDAVAFVDDTGSTVYVRKTVFMTLFADVNMNDMYNSMLLVATEENGWKRHVDHWKAQGLLN